ncbi:MAG: sigma factor [Acidimicrobiales bacterium]
MAGAPAAPEDLVRLCAAVHPRLVRVLYLHCGDGGVAEDLAQEALLRACAR